MPGVSDEFCLFVWRVKKIKECDSETIMRFLGAAGVIRDNLLGLRATGRAALSITVRISGGMGT